MILILLILAIAIVGFVMVKLLNSEIGGLFIIVGCVFLIVSGIIIILDNTVADVEIQNNRIEYDSLCKRLEIINSEYEDISKSDIIMDIAEWNKKVYKIKYWTYNPWTNWYNPKCIADDLNYISLE